MTTDKLNLLICKGDVVIVPAPIETDLHKNEFVGIVVSVSNDYITVEDCEGDCFDIEPNRIEVVDGY